jgi:predicted AAA+ superfamily ATPase
LDEIQRIPNLFPILRSVIDAQKRKGHSVGQFLLLGSASLDLLKQSSESLAGRLASLELTPFLAEEVKTAGRKMDPL